MSQDLDLSDFVNETNINPKDLNLPEEDISDINDAIDNLHLSEESSPSDEPQ